MGLRYSSVSLLREAVPARSRWRRHLPFALFAAAIALLVVAVARPAVTVAVPSNQTTIILSMDVSGSMCSGDIAPNRLVAAEAAAASFIDSQAADSRIGIVAFSGFAEMVQAPTSDRDLLHQALQSLVTGRRTAIGSGILASIDAINSVDPSVPASINDNSPGTEPPPPTPGTYAPDIIVLLTDGANNAGPAPADAAKQAADRGVRVFTIGFGTADGGSFNGECAPPVHRQRAGRRVRRRRVRWWRVRRRWRWRFPPRHRRRHAEGSGESHRRHVPPGRKRRPAQGGIRRPPDEPRVPDRGRRDQRRVRRARGARGSGRIVCSGGCGGRCPDLRGGNEPADDALRFAPNETRIHSRGMAAANRTCRDAMTRLRRAVLVVPATSWSKLEKAAGLDVDEVVIDLEDAVPVSLKTDETRRRAVDAITGFAWRAPTVAVRVNAVGSRWFEDDVAAVVGGAGRRADTIVLPKVESGRHGRGGR